MARGNSRAQSELPSGFEASKRDIQAYEQEKGVSEHGKSFYGDNTLGVSGVKTDEELDAAGVKNPLIRELLKDPVAMKKIAKGFSEVEIPEDKGRWTGGTRDYAWNGERDVDLGTSSGGEWRAPDVWEMGADRDSPSVEVKYKGQYFQIEAQGYLNTKGDGSVIDLSDYDEVGLAFNTISKSTFESIRQREIRRIGESTTSIDLD